MPEESNSCQGKMWDEVNKKEIPCRRPLYDEKYCICHSEDPDKDIDQFESEVQKQLGRPDYHDFRGFVFPGNHSFSGKVFSRDADFISARFGGDSNFKYARFCGNARFDLATFNGSQAEGFDVVILDYDGDGFKAPRPRLSQDYDQATITCGVVGALLCMSNLRLKTGYL